MNIDAIINSEIERWRKEKDIKLYPRRKEDSIAQVIKRYLSQSLINCDNPFSNTPLEFRELVCMSLNQVDNMGLGLSMLRRDGKVAEKLGQAQVGLWSNSYEGILSKLIMEIFKSIGKAILSESEKN